MALSAAIEFDVRPAGNDNNGGGFKAGATGTDRSQQDAAQVAIDNAAITTSITTNVITFTGGYTASAADIGNVVQMLTGTNVTAGFYEITAQTSNTWTVDRNVVTAGTTTDATGKMGGGLASPGKAAGGMVGGNTMHVKSGTNYTVTSASTNVAAGCPSLPNSVSITSVTRVLGYTTTHNDGAPTRPIIKSDGVITTFTLITPGSNNYLEGLELDGNNRTSSRGINFGANGGEAYNCIGRGFTNSFLSGSNTAAVATYCWATGCSTQGVFNSVNCQSCVAAANTFTGFVLGVNGLSMDRCLAYGNTGASTDGFSVGSICRVTNCCAQGNGRNGFNYTTTNPAVLYNCLAWGNSSNDFESSNSVGHKLLYSCAAGTYSANWPAANRVNCVTLSADPFNSAAGGDFSLNNNSGAGASCRRAGIPGTFPNLATTVGYPDIGVAQTKGTGTTRLGSGAGVG